MNTCKIEGITYITTDEPKGGGCEGCAGEKDSVLCSSFLDEVGLLGLIMNNLKHIKIEPLSDEHDCEVCGTSWATGYEVTFTDRGTGFTLQPEANCWGSKDWSEAELMEEILNHLGYTTVNPNEDNGMGNLGQLTKE